MENSINPMTPPRPITNSYSNCWAPTRGNNQQNDTGYDTFFNLFLDNTNQAEAAPAPQVNPMNYPHPPIFYTPPATPETSDSDSDSDSEMDVDDMNNDLSDLHFGGNTPSYSSNSDEE